MKKIETTHTGPTKASWSSAGALYVLAPVGRDTQVAEEALAETTITCVPCADLSDLPTGFAETAGALMLTEEALTKRNCEALSEASAKQPAWSDLPLLVLTNRERSRQEHLKIEAVLQPSRNVTVIERPLRPSTLIGIVQTLLRDRRHQRDMRDLLAELERAKNELEERVTERTAHLRERNEQVRSLAASLTTAEQKERKRISQVLHDEFQQLLYGQRLHIQALRNGVPASRETELLNQMDSSVEEAITFTRTLISELNPPALETEGFGAALPRLAEEMNEQHGLEIEIQGHHPGPVPHSELRVLLFRLVRELLFNVAKHAETDQATLTTDRKDDQLIIRVEDQGIGFDPERAHKQHDVESGFGLFSMKKRLTLFDGTLTVDTAPGEGTRVTLTVPAEGKPGAPHES